MTRPKPAVATGRRLMSVGDAKRIKLPWSEVCLHMGVADKVMLVMLVSPNSAQLLNDDGTPFSHAITPGEAGIFRDRQEGVFYTY